MKKVIFFLFSSLCLIFANDVAVITNVGSVALPKIVVQDSSNFGNSSLRDKFFKLISGDLSVGATFDVDLNYSISSYDGDYMTNIEEAQLIVRYDYDGETSLKIKVLNAKNGKKIFEKSYRVNDASKYPFLAHAAISEIVKTIGNSDVDWMNKMVIYSSEVGARETQIYIADYTLTYQKVVIRGGINIFPKWANDEQTAFYYTTFEKMTPVLYKYNLSGGRERIISSNGMLVCSDVSKDGRKLVLTMAPNDQPDIYIYNLANKGLTKVTNYDGIDVSGNFVNNDSSIVFVSDRFGYPNIFSQNIGSAGVNQLVFHGKNNSALDTFDNYVVYSSREAPGVFNLYLMSVDTSSTRQLTSSGQNLFPRFSSDGGSVVFVKYSGGRSSLGIIRINENKSFQFPLNIGRIQSLDW